MRLLTHRASRSGFLFAAGAILFLALALLLLAFARVQADTGSYPDVHLQRADASGVDFTFAPRSWSLDSTLPDGVALSFQDAQWSTEPGAPAIPQRSVLVAVPPDVRVQITAEPSGWEAISGRRVALRGEPTADRPRPEPPPLVRWDGPFTSRQLRLVRIWLSPVQVQGNQIARTDEVRVSVRWDGQAKGQSLSPNAVFDPVYERTILNWTQARTMGVQAVRSALSNPWAGGSQWFKVTVQSDGPTRITQAELTAAGFPANLDPRQYRLFYAGGAMLPVLNSDPRPVLHEVPIDIPGEADGTFDPSDAIYFFGQASNRWQNDDSDAVYVTNPYTREVVFWLTPSGTYAGSPLRVSTRNAAPGTDLQITTGIARAVSEQDQLLNTAEDDYYTWYWQHAASLSLAMNLPGARAGAGYLAVTARYTLSASTSTVTVNSSAATFAGASGFRARYSAANWLPTTSVQITYTGAFGKNWFDRVEAVYAADLDCSVLREFWLNAASGNRVRLSNVPAGALVWDVTRADSPFVVLGTVAGSTVTLDPQAAGAERRFRVWTRSEAKNIVAVSAQQPGLLRDLPASSDMVIITDPSLRSVVQGYASWRSAASGVGVDVVDVTDIYRDFGFGQFDPIAIRDFLKYAYEASIPKPSACLLVGDASYDFLDNLGTGTPNLVPPFVVSPLVDETVGDQLFVSFGPLGTLDSDTSKVGLGDRGWDMMVARWPVRDAVEAQTMASKIQQYESQPELGTWRNKVVLVADDEFGEAGVATEYFHTEQAEQIDTRIPASYDRHKIYLFEYPKNAEGKKPGARDEIVKSWNEGMLLIDYVGHGSPNVWAHEDVLRRTRDLPQLVNGARLPLVYTASCSIGFFDDPQSPGMGEELVRKAGGGAVAVISATRVVFSGPNVDLNELVFQYLFGPVWMTLGQSLFAALIQGQYRGPNPPSPIENDRKYVLLGDPLMRLARPPYQAVFDTALAPDTIVALRPLRVVGSVIDSASAPVSLGGHYSLSVRDAPRPRQHQVQTRTVNYTLEGRPIFDGAFPATGPNFDFTLMVPKDVSYGADGARVVVYAQGTSSDALGVLAPLPVSTAADSTTDQEGPLWDLTINSVAPAGRVSVGPADVWRAQITDPLGINIGGTAGHNITITVDGDEFSRQDVTGLFRYDVGSISTGSLSFAMPNLTPGPHEIELLAWDNANNPGMHGVSVDASGDVQYEIRDLLVYPNPFNPDVEPASLTYELTFPPDRVELSLFTVAGNRIRTFNDAQADIGFNFATRWDGTDDVGDRVAAGVYILAVEAEAAGHKVKDFTKIVLIRSD